MVSASIARDAPAKVNLALHVTGRRADGFHELESLVVFTRFGDRISVATDDADSVALSGRFAGAVPNDGDNLVARARDLLRATLRRDGPVFIALEKNLPVASGIGGGSSDAAATLSALASLWGAVAQDQIFRIAGELGADVPMCLAARPLLARGIGHDIEPVARFPALAMVLVNPGIAVSTPAVFRALASRENPPLPALPEDPDFSAVISWLGTTRNDLQVAAASTAPMIGTVLDVLADSGAAFVRMSGSGATCFGIFETDDAASRAAAAINKERPSWFVVATRSTASGESFDG
ncbi:4-(cytidine 5'-diphospho)-2-C-methyl-D-erythritol kinase [Mesorhizobium sp. 1B3]|uniref:4-(cytidine 5'-diphospho)-2-C-methyl-D-erythritol kinase n=1 Tax=Mesorhizobium sp. 1B3 TaxID=3243599 RepID=UPI003D972E76